MISTSEKAILSLIIQKIQIIKKYLSGYAFTKGQITHYILRKLLGSKTNKYQSDQIQQNAQITVELIKCIKQRKEEGKSIQDILSEMLGVMERQCRMIEDCEKSEDEVSLQQIGSITQSQKGPSEYKARKILLNKPLTSCSIRDKCEQVESSRRILNQINMIRSFEKELNENMLKTRLLKKLIQQKLQLEMEEMNFSRINQFSQIALESTF